MPLVASPTSAAEGPQLPWPPAITLAATRQAPPEKNLGIALAAGAYCPTKISGDRAAIGRGAARAGGLRNVDGVFAENDSARRATGLAHARAQLRQLFVRVDHVALDGLAGRSVVATVVDRYPKALVTLRATEVGPGHTASHAGDTPSRMGRVVGSRIPSALNARSAAFTRASSITSGRQVAMSGLGAGVKNSSPGPSRERLELCFAPTTESGFFFVTPEGY